MNPPANPSRFVRGRGRGGNGAYRPYFYFRRNGKTIPAGTNDQNADHGPSTRWARGRKRRGGGRFANTAQINNMNDSGLMPPAAGPSFLRAEFFVAPEDAEIIQSITVETVEQCAGWRLYFYKEPYDETSTIAKRIRAIEKHYSTNATTIYDLLKIQATRYFRLDAKIINEDSKIKELWPDLMDDMQKRPLRTLATFGVAMFSIVTLAALDASLSLQASSSEAYVARSVQPKKIYARPVNFCGGVLNFSEVSSENLDNLISLRGHVVAVGEVECAANWICYKCARCTQEQAMRQTGNVVSRPYACKRADCHARKGFVEMRSSPYTRLRAVQSIRLVEHTVSDVEVAARQTISIELHYDLVDCMAPGQDVTVTGVLKMRPLTELERNASNSNGAAQIYLRAMTVQDATSCKTEFSETDLNAIAAIMNEPDSFKLLVHSIAPEVYGQEMAKAGLLLALAGGAGTQLHDESDVSVLLVGDPGTGKSNMLHMCTRVSERAAVLDKKRKTGTSATIATTIQGRSQHALNYGAITSALNGHTIIDDVDRLASEQDTLLQMLQSRCLTLPFNGVYATENVTTSLIASANPVKGHYDHSKLLSENVRINPALCSQFHLVFVLCDRPDKDADTSLTTHIQRVHAGAKKSTAIASRYAMKPKNNNNNSINTHSHIGSLDGGDDDNENYELAHRLKLSALEEADIELLPTILIKKFLLCARQEVKPLLNVAAAEMLREFFVNIQKDQSDEKFGAAIGSSQLAGLIRLSQARARLDFAAEVTKAHIRDVICIVRQSMSDTEIGDYIDLEQSITRTSRGSGIRKFVSMLRMRSGALNRRIFEMSELKEIAIHAGCSTDFAQIIDAVNLQGFLLKKGPNIYEVTEY